MIAQLARAAIDQEGAIQRRGNLLAFRNSRILAIRRGNRALIIADLESKTLVASAVVTYAEAQAINTLMEELGIEARLIRSGKKYLVIRRETGTLKSVEEQ